MTIFTQSYPVRNIVPECWIFSKRFDVVRVHLNSLSVAFVVACAAILASVIISPVNRFAPFFIFGFIACQSVLVGFVNMTSPLSFIGFFGGGRSGKGRERFDVTRERAVLPLPAFLFVLKHWLVALWTRYCNFHAPIAYAFCIGFLVTLESVTARKARFADAPSVGIVSSCASSTSAAGWFAELADLCGRFSAIRAWRKVGLITRWAYSVIARVVVAYRTSVLHNVQYTTNHQRIQE